MHAIYVVKNARIPQDTYCRHKFSLCHRDSGSVLHTRLLMNAAFGRLLRVLHPSRNLRNRYRPNIVAGADLSHSGRKATNSELKKKGSAVQAPKAPKSGTVTCEKMAVGRPFRTNRHKMGPRPQTLKNVCGGGDFTLC